MLELKFIHISKKSFWSKSLDIYLCYYLVQTSHLAWAIILLDIGRYCSRDYARDQNGINSMEAYMYCSILLESIYSIIQQETAQKSIPEMGSRMSLTLIDIMF